MGIRSDAVTVYGSGLAIHWETGKGNAVMNEVRRPASVWNLKPAANGLVFLRTYDPSASARGSASSKKHRGRLQKTAAAFIFFQNIF